MNQRNVDALRALTAEWGARLDRGEPSEGLPEFLAARGVLVPASLTPEECHFLTDGAGFDIVGDLTRIARGDEPA
jgi:hypothetical protein